MTIQKKIFTGILTLIMALGLVGTLPSMQASTQRTVNVYAATDVKGTTAHATPSVETGLPTTGSNDIESVQHAQTMKLIFAFSAGALFLLAVGAYVFLGKKRRKDQDES